MDEVEGVADVGVFGGVVSVSRVAWRYVQVTDVEELVLREMQLDHL